MTITQGVVQEISQRDVSTKFGVKPTYSFKVDGNWIKHGFKNPMVNVGDMIETDVIEGKYGAEASGVKKLGTAPVTSSAIAGTPAYASKTSPVPSYAGYAGGRVFPIPALHGDRSIIRQNALARATDLYLGSWGGKPFSIIPLTASTLIELARKFEAYTAGDLDMEEAVAETTSAKATDISEL